MFIGIFMIIVSSTLFNCLIALYITFKWLNWFINCIFMLILLYMSLYVSCLCVYMCLYVFCIGKWVYL